MDEKVILKLPSIFDFDVGQILYVIFIFVLFGTIITFLYLLFYHLYRSLSWPGEAKIEWTYRVYFGHAFEFGEKPIFQILAPYYGKASDVIGLLIGGQRYFFITDPSSAPLILQEENHAKTSNTFQENLSMNFFNIPPILDRDKKLLVSNAQLRSIHHQFLVQDQGSLTKLMGRILQKMKQIYTQELILPVASSQSPLFALQLQEFLSRCIFHVHLAAFFQPQDNDTPEKASKLYVAYQNYVKALPLTVSGIHLQYFKPSELVYQQLLKQFNTYTHSLSEVQQSRLHYFYQLVSKNTSFRPEIPKYQLSFFWSSISNLIPCSFWVIYCILHHHHYHPTSALIEQIREEIRRNISNYGDFYECAFAIGGEDHRDSINLEELNNLTVLDACITETLRLTSGSLIMHTIHQRRSFTFHSGQTYDFRAGDHLGLSPSIFHYDDNYFPDPHDFQPERWLRGETNEERRQASLGNLLLTTKEGKKVESSVCFFPFGGGDYHCPGRVLMRLEIKLLCILLFMNLEMELDRPGMVPDFSQSHSGIGIYPPKRDVRIVVEKLSTEKKENESTEG